MAAAIDGMQDIIKEFLAESAEGVDVLDHDLIALEREPDSRELLREIFRAVHTLKGNSGALGYSKLESVAHAGENALSRLRDGELTLSLETANGLLAMVDALRGLLRAIEENGNEGDGDYSTVISSLSGLAERAGSAKADEKVRKASLPSAEADSFSKTTALDAGLKARTTRATLSSATCKVQPENLRGGAEAAPPQVATSARSIRVPVGVLDRMMNLVGELVLARNQVLHSALGYSDASLATAAQRLKSVTAGLQESVMKARMQPIGSVWNQLPRLVRDMAAQFGKQIEIEMNGSEIELDRTILEAIKDPLTHILRNAIDHGIESPGERTRAGKTAAGHVRLSAFHEGGRVHVEISDDGAGIDLPRVRQRAVERGLITAEQAASMSEQALARLVFTPGFSTTETVTNISGRGVGLDVVRTNIERIGGVVDLQSVAGQGTTLKINLPLTLAILPVLIVACGGERFAVPQVSLLELVRLDLEHERSAIEEIYGAPVYRLRERLLPLVFLDRALHLPQQNAGVIHIVVLQAGSAAVWAGGGCDRRHRRDRGKAAEQAAEGAVMLYRRGHSGRRTRGADPRCGRCGAVGESLDRPARTGTEGTRDNQNQPNSCTAALAHVPRNDGNQICAAHVSGGAPGRDPGEDDRALAGPRGGAVPRGDPAAASPLRTISRASARARPASSVGAVRSGRERRPGGGQDRGHRRRSRRVTKRCTEWSVAGSGGDP